MFANPHRGRRMITNSDVTTSPKRLEPSQQLSGFLRAFHDFMTAAEDTSGIINAGRDKISRQVSDESECRQGWLENGVIWRARPGFLVCRERDRAPATWRAQQHSNRAVGADGAEHNSTPEVHTILHRSMETLTVCWLLTFIRQLELTVVLCEELRLILWISSNDTPQHLNIMNSLTSSASICRCWIL